jgi:hypothetical protein
MRLNVKGSQGNLIAVGDDFNILRCNLVYTKDSFSGVVTQDAQTVNNDFDWRELQAVLMDKTWPLVSQTFTPGGDNIPSIACYDITMPFSKRFDCIATNNAGSIWDTEEGDLRFQFVSDSAVAPNPTLVGNIRVYFREMDQ